MGERDVGVVSNASDHVHFEDVLIRGGVNGEPRARKREKRGRSGRGRGVVRLENVGGQRTRSGAVGHRRATTATGAVSSTAGSVAHGEFCQREVPGADALVPKNVDVHHATVPRRNARIGAQRFWI